MVQNEMSKTRRGTGLWSFRGVDGLDVLNICFDQRSESDPDDVFWYINWFQYNKHIIYQQTHFNVVVLN